MLFTSSQVGLVGPTLFFHAGGCGIFGTKYVAFAGSWGACFCSMLSSSDINVCSRICSVERLASFRALSFCNLSFRLRCAQARIILVFQSAAGCFASLRGGTTLISHSSRPSTWRSGGAKEDSNGVAFFAGFNFKSATLCRFLVTTSQSPSLSYSPAIALRCRSRRASISFLNPSGSFSLNCLLKSDFFAGAHL